MRKKRKQKNDSITIIDEQQKKLNKALVDQSLQVNVPVKVSLINTRHKIYSTLLYQLADKILSFYAILGIDNYISIYAIKDNGEEILLDIISKEDFSEYCELI